MSCLWTWCCRVHEDALDTDSKGTEEQQIETTKKGKKKRRRSQWRIHWKKERKNNFNKDEETEKDQRLINQQPTKVEEEAHVLGLPVGLASSLENVSAETLEATAPPPQDNLTKEEDAAVQHLMETLLEEVGTCMEQLLKNEHMDTNLAETEEETVEKHLDHLVSPNKGVADAIRELLDIMFDDALSASLQPLENEQMETNLDKTEEETVEKHLDHLVSPNKGVADAIRELLDIMFDDALSASLQPLENDQMDTKLDNPEEETVEKHLDHLVSPNKGVADAIRELLDIMFDDALSASLQPLENDQMDTKLDKPEEETVEKHLDHLVSPNKGVADAIRELLDIMFDDALSASLQPLENDQMDTKLDKPEEETVEKHLDHLVSPNKGVTDAIRELLDIMFDDALSASLQPLENDQMDTKLDKPEEETVEKHLDHLVSSNKDAADAIRELLEIMFDDVLSASLQPLDIEKSHRPEEEKSYKKKTRRGTRGKGRKIIYKKEKYPHDKLDGQRGSRGSSGQTNNAKNCGPESRELVHPRRVHSEWDVSLFFLLPAPLNELDLMPSLSLQPLLHFISTNRLSISTQSSAPTVLTMAILTASVGSPCFAKAQQNHCAAGIWELHTPLPRRPTDRTE
ncbi:hypothetical protein MHYP_G00154120 [Metynnis hypsauchen]